ncbi:MAG TPA: lamin tail domain-containing protein [Candidatus Eisenbacteria bacterium]|jgi:hypothetical protein
MRLATALHLLVLALGLLLTSAATAAAAPLLLNEFLAGPARDWNGDGTFSSRDDEWVEVFNSGTVSLDLGGFLLTDGDSIPRYALSGTLAPGAWRLVYGRDSYDWERANGFPAFGLSLANTGDRVILWQVAAGETLLVDSYAYTSHEAASDRSMGRSPDAGGWALFDGLNLYTGTTPPLGNGCAPTPGNSNACGVTGTKSITWGKLKTLYR